MDQNYQVAELSKDVQQELLKFEQKLRSETSRELVLIAYENSAAQG
jgi:hypothetical protein